MVASRRKKFCATETTLTIFLLILLRQKVGSKLPEANERVVEDKQYQRKRELIFREKKMSHCCDNLKKVTNVDLIVVLFAYLIKAHEVRLRIECLKLEDFERLFRKGD
jgi:hypothetical protein